MADVNARFIYDADFTSAVSQVRILSRELSVLNNSFNSLDKDARKVRDRFAEVFKSDVGNLGAFSARTVDITSNMDNFGKALDRNKLKLRDYAREARKAFQADSNSRKLAEDQVRRTRADLVELGMDASGRRKGILVTPLKLDMSDMQNQMEVARKQFSIFNRLVNDGATQLINWGKNTQWAGRQLTVGLTVPMTIFATTTIKAFNDVDRELTRFQKVYGSDLVGSTTEATNAIRQQVQALAVDIAGSYGIAAKETAGLAADLAATGLEGQKLLDSIKQTTRLSVLGEIDRQDAMKTTLSLQNAFKMSTEELADSINFLNAVENQTSLSLQDLTEAIPKVGPVVRALGGDVKDLSVLMVAMKEGGINAAEGANALKSGLASLINPTKAGSEVAKQYGIDLESIVNKNKGQLLPTVLEFQQSMQTLDDLGKAKIIEQLFGKYQFARISALFDNLNAAGSQTQQVIELMSASNSDLARIANSEIKTLTESASMRFQRSMEAIKAALLPVGEAIVNSVLPFMERFAGVLDRIVSFAQNLPGPIKSFIKAVSGITLVAGPIIMMAGVLGNFAGYIIKGAMAFVNLGRIMRGLPVERFSLLDDTQIAAAKATDTVTISIEKQKSAMVGLNKLMMDYYMLVNKQASRTPGLFNQMPPTPTIGGSPVVPSGARTLPVIRRQKGGAAWVPGSGSGDKIPALLEPGEFVINRNAAKQYGGVLEDINSGVPRFANGGKMPRKIPVPRYRLGATGLAALRLRRQQQSNASAVSNTSRLAALDTMPALALPNNMTGMQALLRDNDTRPARQAAQQTVRQAAQQPNPGGQPLKYGSETAWEAFAPFHPDARIPSKTTGKLSNITYRRQFQARQADEQVSVITSALQNATKSEDLLAAIPQIVDNVKIRTGIGIREAGETKPFPTDSTFPMPKPLNTIYNDILPGKKDPFKESLFSSILTRIADTDELTLNQKKSLFALVSNGDAPAEPELVSFMSTVFKDILEAGLPAEYSQNLAAKMALAATVPAEFISPLKPMSTRLGEGLVYQSTDRSISGLPNTSEWQVASRNLGLESLPLTSQVTANDKATDLLAKSLGIDEDAAKILIQAQKVGEFHVSHAQSGGVIRAIRGIKMPESYATKLATIRQSMSNANKEAMSSNVPLTELGMKQSRIGGHSSAIPGVNGVYEINGQRYVVKGHDTYDSAKAEADMARITRDVFGLQTPNQEVVRVRHPETGDLMFAVRSPYDDKFASSTGTFSEGSVFNQIVASAVRRDKDLQAGNLWDDVVADVGQAGIMSKASQPRTKTGATNSVLEQLAINLGMVKGGARSHGAEGWNATTSSMTDEQIARGIKQAAQEAKSRITTADIPEDFAYITRDLDDIISSDLGPFIAHLRTVTPKVKKPPTAAAIAKKEQQKLLDREERQAALDAGYPSWAMQSGGILRAQNGAWVPGKGEGDRVPALLEPGEFVVNKKAAKQYGGMLEDMNWNLAPRFMQGTPKSGENPSMASMPGMRMGALSGAGMAVGMLTSMAGLPPVINNVIMGFSALTGVLSAAQMVMMKNNAAQAAGASGKASGGMAGMLKNPMAAITRLGPMLLNPWVLATAAVGATVFAVYKYRDSIKQAGKDGKAIFDSQTEAAKELGIELKTTAQNMEAISGNFNALQPTVKAPSVLSVEQQDAIAETDQNKRLIEQLKNSQDAQAILMTQYSRMILDGMMPEEAMAIVKLIAERSGKAQEFFMAAPEMGAIGNQENPQKQFEMSIGSFTKSIANLTPQAAPANETNWQQLFSGSNVTPQEKEGITMGVSTALEAVQMAPDLSSFIKGMDTLTKSVTELEKAGKGLGLEAIQEFAKTKYGEDSSFFKAFDTLPDNLNTVENKLMLITASSAGINLDEFLMDGKFAQEEIDIINQKLKQAGINAEIDLRIKNAAAAQLEKIQKQSIAVQSSYDSSIAKNEQLVDAENERYKKAGKAHQAFIKAKQKEIDSIDKQADKEIDAITKTSEEFLKALSEGDRQSQFSSEQRKTAIGGLGALAGGDIFGFMQSQEQMQANATSFAYDNEITAVEEKRDKEIEAIEEVRKKRVEALQEDIDKRQEAAEKEDEKHEKRLKQLEEQRVAAQTNYTQAMTELQKQEAALQNISTYTGPDFAKMVAGYEGTASMAAKVAAAEVAITALSEGKTVDQAIKAGQDYLSKHALTSSAYNNKILKDSGYSGAGMILQAEGGYIQGPGTATSDSIPARLSNGEYVVKASSVSKYGVGMMNSINEQKFARGGVVGSSDPVDDYSRVRYGNKTFNARTVRMLKRAEEKYGSPFEFYQGSYSTNVKASMGTHDGGGAVDIKPPSNVTKALTALSQAGFWAKWRDKMNPPHIHAIAYGDKELSAAARKQLGLPADYEGDPVEGSQDSIGNIAAVLSALGTNIANVNTVRSKGVRGLMNPRQFGGSMTMNKPYLVGEKGPEVFLPYGAGGKISPISYDVPQNTTGMATQTAAIAGGITTQESSNVYYNVNVDASATNNPRDVANYVIRALKQEENRRSFSRRIS